MRDCGICRGCERGEALPGDRGRQVRCRGDAASSFLSLSNHLPYTCPTLASRLFRTRRRLAPLPSIAMVGWPPQHPLAVGLGSGTDVSATRPSTVQVRSNSKTSLKRLYGREFVATHVCRVVHLLGSHLCDLLPATCRRQAAVGSGAHDWDWDAGS